MLFTDDHEQLRRLVRRFVDEEINPHVTEWEKACEFPSHEIFAKMGKLGLLGITYDEAYGGQGLDPSFAIAAAEELGRIHCGGVPMAIGVQTDMSTPALHRFGSDELKREFLAPAIAGEMVTSIAVSEPGAGSDVAAIKTTARKDGGDYVIDGTKMWITNGMKSDWACVLAETSAEGGPHGNKSLIIVPLNLPGVTRQKIDKMGMRSSDTAQLFFDDVRVPQRHLIGAEGQGFMMQMVQFQLERLWGAANCCAGMVSCVDATLEYTRERMAFGKPLIANQSVQFAFASMRTEIEALRALIYRATEMQIQGEDVTRLASMAKLKSGELARVVGDQCVQFWGGMGFTDDNIAARFYRDGRLTSIGGGADEIMMGIVCKMDGMVPKRPKPGTPA